MDCERSASGFARRLAVCAVAAAIGAGVVAALPAHAATSNRAAVVVYVNGTVHTARVTFSTDSISGLDALRDAGFAPSVRVFGGNGGAVCALDVGGTTIGCPADGSCLKCDKDSNYWAYFRALAGATQYTYSGLGAGSTQVRDGDVEAWAWGTGAVPAPFVSFDQVWAPVPTTTRPPPTTPPTTRSTQPRPPPTLGPLGTVTTTASTSTPPDAGHGSTTTHPTATTARRAATSTTSPRPATGDRSVATGVLRKIATAPVVARGGGGSPYGLIGFGAILAALVGAIVFARRRRASGVAGGQASI